MIYIALLRGINVGRHYVKMKRIRELFRELGFTNVRTYMQSGNVFFETTETDRQELTQMIEPYLIKALNYNVSVFLRTVPEMEQILAIDPFKDMDIKPDMRLCVIFTAEKISPALALPLFSPKGDMEIIQTRDYEAFVIWHHMEGRTQAAPVFKELGNKTTTRFFYTARNILEGAKEGKVAREVRAI